MMQDDLTHDNFDFRRFGLRSLERPPTFGGRSAYPRIQ